MKETLRNKGLFPVLGTCPDCSIPSDHFYMQKMSFSQPFKTFLIASLPLLCLLTWFNCVGYGLDRASTELNALDIYTINLLDSLNPISIEIKREIGSRIIMRHGEIMNTGIILGSHNETMIPGFVQWPVAGKALAHFHTHGDDDPLYDSENFSVNDTLGCKEVQYLETPRGKILKHIPRDHVVMQYDRVLKMWLPLGNAQIIKSFLERK